jgi:hypothetical protein
MEVLKATTALRVGVAKYGSIQKVPVEWLVLAGVPTHLAEQINVMVTLSPDRNLEELLADLHQLAHA